MYIHMHVLIHAYTMHAYAYVVADNAREQRVSAGLSAPRLTLRCSRSSWSAREWRNARS